MPVVKPAKKAAPKAATSKTKTAAPTRKAVGSKKRKREASSGDESSGVENAQPVKKTKTATTSEYDDIYESRRAQVSNALLAAESSSGSKAGRKAKAS